MADNLNYKGAHAAAAQDPAAENLGLLGGPAGVTGTEHASLAAATDGGLCGCFRDMAVCLTGWCCPCVLFGQSLKRARLTRSTCAGCVLYMVPALLLSVAAAVFLGSVLTDPAFLALVDPRCHCNTTSPLAGLASGVGNSTSSATATSSITGLNGIPGSPLWDFSRDGRRQAQDALAAGELAEAPLARAASNRRSMIEFLAHIGYEMLDDHCKHGGCRNPDGTLLAPGISWPSSTRGALMAPGPEDVDARGARPQPVEGPPTRAASLEQCLQGVEAGGVGTPADVDSFAAAENADEVATAGLNQALTAELGYGGFGSRTRDPLSMRVRDRDRDPLDPHGRRLQTHRKMQLKEQDARETQCRRDDCHRRHGGSTTALVGGLQHGITAGIGADTRPMSARYNSNAPRYASYMYGSGGCLNGNGCGGRRQAQDDPIGVETDETADELEEVSRGLQLQSLWTTPTAAVS